MPTISARFRERLRESNYSVSYFRGPQIDCVKRRGRKATWFIDGSPVSQDAARDRMQELDAERRG